MKLATNDTYTVIAISKETGNRKVIAHKAGAFRASRLANAIKQKGFNVEVKLTGGESVLSLEN